MTCNVLSGTLSLNTTTTFVDGVCLVSLKHLTWAQGAVEWSRKA